MAYTSIDDPAQYFNTVLYTGNGSTQSITGVGFQPDWVWNKNRSSARNHYATDSVRGAQETLRQNLHDIESTQSGGVTAFNSDGFSVGSDNVVNESGDSLVAWCWKENATAGFDIVSYSGTGSQPATVSHSLGAIPDVVLVKPRNDAQSWAMFHQGIGAANIIYLDVTSAAGGTPAWNSTSPTSSVFTVNDNQVNKSSTNYIAYCFKGIKGYSKFGSYTGNGSTDGTFVYTGFRPAWLLVKDTGANGENWELLDATRSPFNVADERLKANDTDAESTGSNYFIDFLSNGFKQRNSQTSSNGSGETYIYMAFAESPFVNSNGVPTNAR